MVAFNESFKVIDVIPVVGADSLDGITLANTDAVDNGDGTVKLTATAAHGLLAGSAVYIEGTANYDGLKKLLAIPAATTFNIDAKYVAEELAGTETVKVALVSHKDFMFLGLRMNIAVAPGQADVLTVTLDSARGANFDTVLYTKDLDAVTDLEYIHTYKDLPISKDDILRVAWPNVANRTFAVDFFVRTLN